VILVYGVSSESCPCEGSTGGWSEGDAGCKMKKSPIGLVLGENGRSKEKAQKEKKEGNPTLIR